QRLGAKAGLQFTQDRLKCRLGGELFLEQYQWQTFETLAGQPGSLLSNFEELRRPVQLFSQLAYDFAGGWGLEAGFSYNWLQYTVEDQVQGNAPESYAFAPNPSFFVGGKKSLGTDFHLYTALGQGFSYPSLQETLLPEGTTNPDIRPEQALDLDLGARAYLFNHRLFLDGSLFGIWTDELLLTVQLVDGSSFGRNAGKTQHLGAELQAQWALVPTRLRVEVAATLGRYRFLEFEDNGTDFSGNQLPGAPAFISTSQLHYQATKHWTCRLQHQFVSRQWLNDANTDAYGGYHLLHFDTQYTWAFKNEQRLVFSITLRNLTDTSYAPMLLTNATGFGGNAPRYYYPGQ
ncbi:MAG: TonB-dependent receptor, partial [Phaeodactylibacter sp.]|nr:TonB-dependent receptor [Phaeodactylibacter sp.]